MQRDAGEGMEFAPSGPWAATPRRAAWTRAAPGQPPQGAPHGRADLTINYPQQWQLTMLPCGALPRA
eukprot:6272003-Alexandrium_andersonii.AAC.1